MPKLSIEINDLVNGCYSTRIKVDGVLIGVVQRFEIVQHMEIPEATIEIDQIIYSRAQLPMMRLLQTVPNLRYRPIFVGADGDTMKRGGSFVTEAEACFIEDKCAMCAHDPQHCVEHA